MSIIEVENITKTFGIGSGRTTAIDGINLTIEKGSFSTIIGRSGSGKSTLLNILGGIAKPDSGKVLLEGIDIFKLKERKLSGLRRKKIGFVFQAYNLIPEFTVLENIYLPSYLDQKKPNIEFIKDIIEILEIKELVNKYPYEMSGGEQQRTAIARALSTKPDLLLADEPTGNLDLKSGEQVLEAIRVCHRIFNQTILMVTHDLEISQYAKRVITLEDGKIVSNSIGECI